MDKELEKKAGEIFFQAVELEDDQRDEWIVQACGDDSRLRQRVDRLIAAHDEPGSEDLFDQETVAVDGSNRRSGRSAEAVVDAGVQMELGGDQIGRYRLIEQLGEGGFGTVWSAEQLEPISRQVALKVIKVGMDTREVIARFEAERQALALMEHPNIAKVFDAGATGRGRPFFVMELVNGLPVTEFCDAAKLGARERLQLFVEICGAVSHAHQKGIVHRDLKPSNILAGFDGDRPTVTVIDFGIAKAIHQPLTDETIQTQWNQFIGTPQYMSPEQAGLAPQDIDTRSDIYSLGVILFELLSGRPPISRESLLEGGLDEMRRVICEQEPPRLSTLVSTIGDADLKKIASQRRMQPSRLRQFLRDDLDWILHKTLEKDRERRYETAGALVDDIRRFLDNETVSAMPPSALYQFRKFARRHRGALVTTLAVAAALVAGTIVSTWQAIEAHQAREELSATLTKTRVALAEQQRLAGNLDNAHTLLDRCPPEHRRWEWYLLQELLIEKVTSSRDSTIGDEGLAISPDGLLIAYPKAIGVVLRSADGSRTPHYLEVSKGHIEALVFNHSGTQLACVANHGYTGWLSVWDVVSGERLYEMASGGSGVGFSLAFSRDDQQLYVVGGDEIYTWSMASGELMRSLTDETVRMKGLAVSGDGSQFLTTSKPAVEPGSVEPLAFETPVELVFRDVNSGGVVRRIPLEIDFVRAIAFSPDSGRFAMPRGSSIELWNVAEGRIEKVLEGHRQAVDALAFSLDGRQLISGGRDKSVRLWDVQSGRELRVLRGHETAVQSVATVGADSVVASISVDGETRLWGRSATSFEAVREFEFLSEDGSRAGTAEFGDGGGLSEVRLWDPGKSLVDPISLELPSEELPGGCVELALSPDGGYVALSATENMPGRGGGRGSSDEGDEAQPASLIYLVDAAAGTLRHRLEAKVEDDIPEEAGIAHFLAAGLPYSEVVFSPQGDRLAAIVVGRAVVWDVETGGRLTKFRPGLSFVERLAWPPGDRSDRLLCGCEDGSLRLIDLSDGSEVFRVDSGVKSVTALAISPDGALFAASPGDNRIRIWSRATGNLLYTLAGHADVVHELEFSSYSGDRLASHGLDNVTRFWDLSSGEEVVSFPTKQISREDWQNSLQAAGKPVP